MPGAHDLTAIFFHESRPAEFGHELVEDATVDVVDVKAGPHLTRHPLECAATILVGHRRPVPVDAAPRTDRREGGGHAAMPVKNSATGIEGQGLDGERHGDFLRGRLARLRSSSSAGRATFSRACRLAPVRASMRTAMPMPSRGPAMTSIS